MKIENKIETVNSIIRRLSWERLEIDEENIELTKEDKKFREEHNEIVEKCIEILIDNIKTIVKEK